jgi:hypothetical protein
LVTIGDSNTHGFMSVAIFRTDLSWPLGEFQTLRRLVYEAPSGPVGSRPTSSGRCVVRGPLRIEG